MAEAGLWSMFLCLSICGKRITVLFGSLILVLHELEQTYYKQKLITRKMKLNIRNIQNTVPIIFTVRFNTYKITLSNWDKVS